MCQATFHVPGRIPGKDPSLGWVSWCVQELLVVGRAVGVEKLLCKEGRRNVGLHLRGKGSPIAALSTGGGWGERFQREQLLSGSRLFVESWKNLR